MRKLFYTIIPVWTVLLTPMAQSTIPAYEQNPADQFLLFEAEDYQLFDNRANATFTSWTTAADGAASGGEALLATTGSPGSIAVNSTLLAAKAQYNLKFANGGTYYLYARFRSPTGNQSIGVSEDLNGPPRYRAIVTGSTTYTWAYLGQSYSISDLNHLYMLALRPWSVDVYVDRILLSQSTSPNFAAVDAAANTPALNINNDIIPNLLRYTTFEGTGGELGIANGNNYEVIDTMGIPTNNRSLVYIGRQNLFLNGTGNVNNQIFVEFDPVLLTCGYTNTSLCVRFFTPTLTPFELDDSLIVSVNFLRPPLADTTIVVERFDGTSLNVLSNAYNLSCFSFTPPTGAITAAARLQLKSNSGNEDLFVDELYLTGTAVGLPVTTMLTTTVNPVMPEEYAFTVVTNGSNVVLDYGDGTFVNSPAPITTHTYTANGIYLACLLATDMCGNQLTIDCDTIVINNLPPLPVTWLGFAAAADGEDVLLRWSTAEETDNDYFVVEHSRDGRVFNDIGRTDGQGDSRQVHHYEFRHVRAGAGRHYYRIKQVDLDEAYSYSALRSVQMEGAAAWRVYPNPSQGAITLESSKSEEIQYALFDLHGRRVVAGVITPGRQLQLPVISNGLYWLRLTDEQGGVLHETQLIIQD